MSSLPRAEFAEIFSRFGNVAHAVILATVDNASRRRGFVVMNRHHEAKAAMDGLNRKDIKYVRRPASRFFPDIPFARGHIIDVSWAVVQRSEGKTVSDPRNMISSSTRLP